MGGSKSGNHGARKTAAINAAVIAVCVLSLVPLLVIGVYDRPSADDFSYSLQTHQAFVQTGGNPVDVLAAAVKTSADYYQSWQGLYTSAFLLALQPGIAGGAWYPLGFYAIMAFIFAACLYLAMCVERRLLATGTRLWPAVGALAATFFIQCMPSAVEGVFWYNGAANYTPILFASFFTAGLCITAARGAGRTRRGVALGLATVLSFVISGGNYMPAFFNLMLMACFLVIGCAKRRFASALPAIAAVVGFVVSATAPGTAVRQSFFEQPGVLSTVAHSVWRNVQDLAVLLGLPFLVLMAVLVPVFVLWAGRSRHEFTARNLAVLAVLAFAIASAALCVPFYAMGSFGEGRVRDTTFFIDSVLALTVWFYAVGFLASRAEGVPARVERLWERATAPLAGIAAAVGIAAFVLAGLAWGSGNAVVAIESLASGEARAYAAEYDAREAVLLDAAASGAESVEVEALSVQPSLLFFSDIVGRDDWSGAYAQYYGLESVEVDA